MSFSIVEEKIGYIFSNKDIIQTALTHPSYSVVDYNNERLEFLGDAVLELVISEFLYKNLSLPEGKMTKLRANIVCTESLSKAAEQLHLGKELRLGKGEVLTGGHKRRSNLANVFEAVMGGIFLDSNYETVRDVILKVLHENIEMAMEGKLVNDYKTKLQELIQKDPNSTIYYHDLKATGPEHDQVFTVEVVINGKSQAQGKGKTKKEAQQEAAKNYLAKVEK